MSPATEITVPVPKVLWLTVSPAAKSCDALARSTLRSTVGDTLDDGRVASTFGSGAPRAKKPSSKVSPTVERKVDRASASQDFAAGDTVSHKTFGTGTVISVAGDMIEVQFEKTGQTKKLMKGFAPIVKLNA